MGISSRPKPWLRSSLLVLLFAGGACADDVPGITTLGDTGTGTTSDSPTSGITTTVDPDSTGVATMGMDSGGTTDGMTDGMTTDTPTTTGPEECGNGVVEGAEDCDSEDLDGQDCTTQGFAGGALGCNADCTFDTSSCSGGRTCGNDMAEGAEECDGTDLAGETCVTQGFGGGTLACAADCTLDASGCMNGPACGNGAIDGMDVCDGADLGGEDCVSQGFAGGGVLACLGDCSGFDTAGCMGGGGGDCCAAHMGTGCDDPGCEAAVCGADAFCCDTQWDDICANEAAAEPACAAICGGGGPVCGNDLTEAPEVCDGADLAMQDCVSQGFAGGGVLACLGDCSGFDTGGCMGGGASNCCVAHMGMGCDNAACQASVCAADAFCCNNQWDGICANEAIADPACAAVCGGGGPVCGNAVVEAPEVCDGAALNGQTCVSQGFAGGGVLACNAGCGSFDTAGCIMGGGADCCAAHAGLGCGNAACEASVCAADAFCCNNQWDGICANEAIADPACAGAGGTCPGGGGPVCGNAVVEAPEVCDGAALNGQTCVSQGFAGGGVLACNAGCGSFNTAGCMGMAFVCQDQDIASAIGAAVAMGNTAGADNDLDPSCGAGDANDQVIRFVAPAAGQYTFNTFGSSYDTILALFSDCATQVACNDDTMGLQSQVVRMMAAGEVVLVLVDGYNGATGNWTLNITSP